MEVKILAAVKKLLGDFKDLSARVGRLEKVKPAVVNGRDGKDGRDGVSPSVEEVVSAVVKQLPEPERVDTKAIVEEVVAKIPKPRDGRDAQQVNVSDVAAIVLAKIPKPRDGKDGRNGPDLETVVKRVKAQVRNGDTGPQGPRGPQGPAGKDGVSVTDVQLNGNDLFVFLDGAKKKAGSIKLPTLTAPFNPGNAGGGGSARQVNAAVAIKNRVVINKTGDWPEESGGSINLQPFTEYYIGSDDVGLPAKISLSGPTYINGGANVSKITYLGSDPMINGSDFGALVMSGVSLDLPNAELLNIEDLVAPASVVNIMDLTVFRAAGIGSYTDILGITFSLINFVDLTQGARDLGTLTSVLSAERVSAISPNSSFKFFDFGSNVYTSLEFSNIRTDAPAGAFTFSGLVDNGNVASGQTADISSCEFLGGVSPLEGITKDDYRYRFEGNGSAIPDTNPDALISLVGNVSPTPVAQGVPTKLVGSWSLESESHFESDATGRITYRAEVPITVPVDIVIDIAPVSGTNKDVVVYAALNGSAIVGSGRGVRLDANNPRPVPVVWQQTFNQDDYLEVFVENTTDSVSLLGSGGVSRIR